MFLIILHALPSAFGLFDAGAAKQALIAVKVRGAPLAARASSSRLDLTAVKAMNTAPVIRSGGVR
jgi:hypothetical protein